MGIRMNHGDEDLVEKAEINVTPFVDVMLVLLIIFMVAAPLATVDVDVDLPTSTAQPQKRPDKPIFITLKTDDRLVVDDSPVSKDELGSAIDKLSGGAKTQTIFLRADKTTSYNSLMQVMNALRDAGYLKIGLVAMDQNQAMGQASNPGKTP